MNTSNYYFYILYSDNLDKYYIGSTSNLEERLKKHNFRHKGFTGQTKDWKLVYSEEFQSKQLACLREQQVKAWKNRDRIESLIKRNN